MERIGSGPGAGSVAGRGRARGRERARGRVRTRGGTVRTRGGLTERPSMHDELSTQNISSIEQTSSLERTLHVKRVRTLLPKPMSHALDSQWSSEVTGAGSSSSPDSSPLVESLQRVVSAPPSPSLLVEYCDNDEEEEISRTEERPSEFVECHYHDGEEISRTEKRPSELVECHYHDGEEISRSEKRPSETPTSSAEPSAKKRFLLPTPSSRRPLRDEEITGLLDYGSEEDSDESGDEGTLPSSFVPRAARMFIDTDDSLRLPPTVRPVPSVVEDQPHEPEPQLNEPLADSPFNLHKFDFEWSTLDNNSSQTDPCFRRDPFSQINCGPTASYASPYEAFIAYWDRGIMEHIVIETNRYAQQVVTVMLNEGTMYPKSRMTKWVDTTVDEVYLYFGIVLGTGIVPKSRLEEFWAKDVLLGTPGFSGMMSYDRFHLLSKCLHFADNLNCNPDRMTRSQAKIFKIRVIIDHLNNKFAQLYRLSQNIALDESLTMWKGWLEINQFINNKAATVGIKTYEICESKTGYLWRFEIHAGHDNAVNEESPVSGTVPALVLRLLNGLEHMGHTVWMDNFYNSPALARELKTLGFDCVGTLRTNRRFVPNEITTLKKSDMPGGSVAACTSGDVDIVVWRDKNRVALISTYHGLRYVDCGGQSLKPSIIPDYNACMGGVDRKDQMLAMYPIERKRTRVWYKKLFRRLLNVSVLNAYILFKADHTISHRSFRKTLMAEIVSKHGNTPTPTPESLLPGVPHVPAQYDIRTSDGNTVERQRRTCIICKKRTRVYCLKCGPKVPLCNFTCFVPHINNIR